MSFSKDRKVCLSVHEYVNEASVTHVSRENKAAWQRAGYWRWALCVSPTPSSLKHVTQHTEWDDVWFSHRPQHVTAALCVFFLDSFISMFLSLKRFPGLSVWSLNIQEENRPRSSHRLLTVRSEALYWHTALYLNLLYFKKQELKSWNFLKCSLFKFHWKITFYNKST